MWTFVVCIGYLIFTGLVCIGAGFYIAYGDKPPEDKK